MGIKRERQGLRHQEPQSLKVFNPQRTGRGGLADPIEKVKVKLARDEALVILRLTGKEKRQMSK